MKLTSLSLLVICTLLFSFIVQPDVSNEEYATLPVGAKAPDFKLQGTDGKSYTLASFSKSKLFVIIFTCNHCPTAQACEK